VELIEVSENHGTMFTLWETYPNWQPCQPFQAPDKALVPCERSLCQVEGGRADQARLPMHEVHQGAEQSLVFAEAQSKPL